jgi:hypothetical protein
VTFRKLPGIETPKLDSTHDDSDLHDFIKKSLTWENRPDEKDVIETVEGAVKEFCDVNFELAENIIEIFNITESMDFAKEDKLLLELQTEIVRIEEEVTKKYIRAQYAFYMMDDKYWAAYKRPVSGTTNDLTAYAKTNTKEDRYFYFVQYAAWKQINDKLQGIKTIAKQIYSRQYHR